MTTTESKQQVSYFIFDIETIADGDLVSKIRYPNDNLSPDEALARYRVQLLAETGKDVLPVTFVLPISVAVAKVDAEYRLLDVAVLDSPQFRPHVITRHFWQGWNAYGRPTLVSFNGRGYDIPVLELPIGMGTPYRPGSMWKPVRMNRPAIAITRWPIWIYWTCCQTLALHGSVAV